MTQSNRIKLRLYAHTNSRTLHNQLQSLCQTINASTRICRKLMWDARTHRMRTRHEEIRSRYSVSWTNWQTAGRLGWAKNSIMWNLQMKFVSSLRSCAVCMHDACALESHLTHCKRCKSGKQLLRTRAARTICTTAHWQVAATTALVAVGRWQWIYLCYFHFIYIFRFLSFLHTFLFMPVRNVHRFGWLRTESIPMWKSQKARRTRMHVAFVEHNASLQRRRRTKN